MIITAMNRKPSNLLKSMNTYKRKGHLGKVTGNKQPTSKRVQDRPCCPEVSRTAGRADSRGGGLLPIKVFQLINDKEMRELEHQPTCPQALSINAAKVTGQRKPEACASQSCQRG